MHFIGKKLQALKGDSEEEDYDFFSFEFRMP